ncbi:TM2 domain-containing protein [Thalassospira sp.]|uniref:TM2 domain-containing protein n=1 Tax=Thalassospira sp. TaxID=1912094 RepID=UPI00311E9DAD
MIHCTACGKEISESATACPSCGHPNSAATGQVSDKGFVPALLLCFFLGSFGFHRFYVGKVGTGILMLLTLGAFGIWTLIDFIIIAIGNFRDKDGLLLKR